VGEGPFPGILFNHGSYGVGDTLEPTQPAALGTVFAKHGYVFLFLYRQGVGLSTNQGPAEGDLMAQALADHGEAERNRVQLHLLRTEALAEARAGLAFLRALPSVNPRQIGIVGHSFGGSLTLFLATYDTTLRAAVIFAGSARSWNVSPELRRGLLDAVGRTSAPLFFIHAANDYSTAPGEALAAEMQRLGKPHRLKIYPPAGRLPSEGHNFLYRHVAMWEPDVFAFLDEYVRR
jgi:dienelactone hydrolase